MSPETRSALLTTLRQAIVPGTFTSAAGLTLHGKFDLERILSPFITPHHSACVASALLGLMDDVLAPHQYPADIAGADGGGHHLMTALNHGRLNQGKRPFTPVQVETKKGPAHISFIGITNIAPPPGTPVIFVEDVVTTGATTLKAIRALRAAGYRVTHAFAVVDRSSDRKPGTPSPTALLMRENIIYLPLTLAEEILPTARAA